MHVKWYSYVFIPRFHGSKIALPHDLPVFCAHFLPGILGILQEVGGILCTRFFLVDLAAAPWSPYEIQKSYPLFRWGRGAWESPGKLVDLEKTYGEMMGNGEVSKARNIRRFCIWGLMVDILSIADRWVI